MGQLGLLNPPHAAGIGCQPHRAATDAELHHFIMALASHVGHLYRQPIVPIALVIGGNSNLKAPLTIGADGVLIRHPRAESIGNGCVGQWHTSHCGCLSCNHDGVATGNALVVVVDGDLECRPLVLLDTQHSNASDISTVGLLCRQDCFDAISAMQQVLFEREASVRHAIIVGHDLRCVHRLSFAVQQLHLDGPASEHGHVIVLASIGKHCQLNVLTRPVNSAVGHHIEMGGLVVVGGIVA